MAVPKTFKPYAATLGATTIKGLVSCDTDLAADQVTQRADGATSITRVYTEGHRATVTLTAEVNESLSGFKVGDSGVLTVSYYQQVEGANTGAPTTAARTAVFPKTGDTAKAVVVAIRDGAPHRGQPTLAITFAVAAASGLPADLYSITDV
jgi:hypothetical protein